MQRIGHRGAAGWEPQNTELSFLKAIDLDCDMIETDVHLCATGELVLAHDPWVSGLGTEQSSIIRTTGLQELRQHDLGRAQHMMLLEELLDLAEGRIALDIELKAPGTGAAVAAVLKQRLQSHRFEASALLVTSFIHRELITFKQLLPEVRIGILLKAALIDPAAYIEKLDAAVLVSSSSFLDRQTVEELQRSGKQVFVYTPNSREEISRFTSMGVDGIISDHPERIIV